MNTPDNIDCFHACAALMLGELYAQFPRRVNLFDDAFEQIMIQRGLPKECVWQVANPYYEDTLFSGTVAFLASNGVIVYRSEDGGTFMGVTLTGRGLQIMEESATPENPQSVSIGATLKKVATNAAYSLAVEGSKQAVKVAIHSFLSFLR